MKSTLIVFILSLLFSVLHQTSLAQDADKTVTITVSGSGKTQDEARKMALRSAIEQAFGTFISSKTEILNDNLLKDEIVSVTNGNIQKFDVLSEVQIPNVGFASTLKAVVSVSKLTSFCVSRGVTVEFKGSTFAMNIKLQKLNEEAEYKAILNLCEVSKELLSKSLDYSLIVKEPISVNGGDSLFNIHLDVICSPNNNMKSFQEYFRKTLLELSMKENEIESYDAVKKNKYQISCLTFKGDPTYFFNNYNEDEAKGYIENLYLRNSASLFVLKNLMLKSNDNLFDFKITSEVDTIYLNKNQGFYHIKRSSYEAYYENNNDKWNFESKPFPAIFQMFSRGENIMPDDIWSLYLDMLSEFGNSHFIWSDNYYLTSTEKDFNSAATEKNFHRNEQRAYYFDFKITSNTNPIYIFKSTNNIEYKIEIDHTISLKKIEKLSNYKIEPIKKIISYTELFVLQKSPEWIKWLNDNLRIGNDQNLVIIYLQEIGFSRKSILEAIKEYHSQKVR